MRRTLLRLALAGIFGVPVVAMTLVPDAGGMASETRTTAAVIATSVRKIEHVGASRWADQAAMVLTGSALIGAAAAVRRAA